jgi:hypothetical protein
MEPGPPAWCLTVCSRNGKNRTLRLSRGNPTERRMDWARRYHRRSMQARAFAQGAGGAAGRNPSSQRSIGLGQIWMGASRAAGVHAAAPRGTAPVCEKGPGSTSFKVEAPAARYPPRVRLASAFVGVRARDLAIIGMALWEWRMPDRAIRHSNAHPTAAPPGCRGNGRPPTHLPASGGTSDRSSALRGLSDLWGYLWVRPRFPPLG